MRHAIPIILPLRDERTTEKRHASEEGERGTRDGGRPLSRFESTARLFYGTSLNAKGFHDGGDKKGFAAEIGRGTWTWEGERILVINLLHASSVVLLL